jgi:predicted MFS family arabinose efflux permease
MRLPDGAGATLLLCLLATQASVLVLTPVLPDLARDLGVSTAAAGQLRTVSALVAAVVAVLVGRLGGRAGLRELIAAGLAALVGGALGGALSPGFGVLVAAQTLAGVGIALVYAAAVSAAAEWAPADRRSETLAWALLGPPLAWVVCMPLIGLAAEAGWRVAWLTVPVVAALAAGVAVLQRPSLPPTGVAAGPAALLRERSVRRWALGELLAFGAFAGTLVYSGALLVETYGVSTGVAGLALGVGAIAYVPGNMLFRHVVDGREQQLLVVLGLASAATVWVLGAVHPSLLFSVGVFAVFSFLAGGRTLAGSALGLGAASDRRLGVMGLRTAAVQLGYLVGAAAGGAALALGGYGALGACFAVLLLAAVVPHAATLAGRRAAVRVDG